MDMRLREYAVHADFGHIREFADADDNLIHINHIEILAKNGNFGKIWVRNWSRFVAREFFLRQTLITLESKVPHRFS